MKQEGKLGTVAEYEAEVSDQGVLELSIKVDLIEQLQKAVAGKEDSFFGRLVSFISERVRPVKTASMDLPTGSNQIG